MMTQQSVSYNKCCCFENGNCGPYTRPTPHIDQMFETKQLTESTHSHLVNLKVLKVHELTNEWNERTLIENRLTKTIEDIEQICAYHRYTLGIGWRQGKQCMHPEHIIQKGKKAAPVRAAPISMTLQLSSFYGVHVPVGSVVCDSHRKQHYANTQHQTSETQSQETSESKLTDDDFIPEEVFVDTDELDSSLETGNNICTSLGMSPIKFQFKRKLENVDESTKKQMRWKYKRMEESLKRRFSDSIAPGQSNEFLSILNNETSEAPEETEIPNEIVKLADLYKNSDAMARCVILSLIDHSKYTKNFLSEAFSCSKYRIDQARKWRASYKGLILPQKPQFTRERLSIPKCEHFLDFIFSSGLLQDVSYGVSKIKYDSGDVQTVARAIVTSKYSHTIALYHEICNQVSYESLSVSSLMRILNAIKPSQRRCLAGINDTAAAGMNSFATLEHLASKFGKKSSIEKLERSRRYLKTRYQLHCSELETDIASHSTTFSLSDPQNLELQSDTYMFGSICYDCNELCEVLNEMNQLAKDHSHEEEVLYDIKVSINNILDYMKHLMRDCQQKKAKTDAYMQLDNKTAFWLKDYAQKVLPVKFREGQKEYFGKKGMSMHIDVFFLKENNCLKKHVYFTVIYRCDQGISSVISIADAVLDQFHKDEPNIVNLFAKSDNANCYHGNYSAESMYELCKSKGLNLLRYDFNEPCCGKDQCDRESASAKTILRSYVDAGNDLLTAEDVSNAVQYGYGVKDGMVAVARVEHVELTGPKIPNISYYHSYKFEDDGMVLWRYYNIGQGVKIPYSQLSVEPSIELIVPFKKTDGTLKRMAPRKETKKRDNRGLNMLHFCQQAGCSQSFKTSSELDDHLLSGKHHEAEEASSLDKVRKIFVEKMKATSEVHNSTITAAVKTTDTPANNQYTQLFQNQGWALPVRSTFRFTNKQKKVLHQYFIKGEKTGKKMSPEEVHTLLRKDLSADEYVTSQQIRSLFSRWSKLLSEGKSTKPTLSENETIDEDQTDDSGEVDFYENKLHSLATEVSSMWLKDDWVVIVYDEEWYPGVVTEVTEAGTVVDCMQTIAFGKNCFRWPIQKDTMTYSDEEVLCTICPPVPINQRGDYCLEIKDFDETNKLFLKK